MAINKISLSNIQYKDLFNFNKMTSFLKRIGMSYSQNDSSFDKTYSYVYKVENVILKKENNIQVSKLSLIPVKCIIIKDKDDGAPTDNVTNKKTIDELKALVVKSINNFNAISKFSLTFMYEDENHNVLSSWKSMEYNEFMALSNITLLPYNSKYLGIYVSTNNSYKKVYTIDLTPYKYSFDTRHYRVGLMSDIHYNDTSIDSNPETIENIDGSEYDTDLINALEFYQNKEDISFMCAAGDVSTDSKEHLRNFALNLKTYAPTTPFYSCLGNHDFQSTHYELNQLHDDKEFGLTEEFLTRIGIWNEHITPDDNTIHYYNSNTEEGKLSYWFEHQIPGTNKSDIYVMLSVDYGVTHDTRQTKSNWDIQAAQKMLNYESQDVQQLMQYLNISSRTELQKQYDYQFYDSYVLLWLKDLLQTYSTKRIFIFTHQFFSQKAGTNNSTSYYNYSADYWRISQKDDDQGQVAYCLCGLQFEFLNKLNNVYRNSIWFTGHSHYKWKWQITDPTINVCNKDFNILTPDKNFFTKDFRYLRYIVDESKSFPTPKEYYTTNLYSDVPVLYGTIYVATDATYEVSLIATAAYTPGRGVTQMCNENDDDIAYVQINMSNKHYIPVKFITTISNSEYATYKITITATSVNNKLDVTLYSEKQGCNWYTLNVLSIKNLSNNEITNINNSIIIKKRGGNIANTVSYSIINYTSVEQKNIVTTDCAYNIHLPSLARPIPYATTSYSVALDNSEGAIMDVYEDYVDIRGIVFKESSNTYENKYYPLAQYRIPIHAA